LWDASAILRTRSRVTRTTRAAISTPWPPIGAILPAKRQRRHRPQPGPNDFDLFHFDRWSKLSGLGCIYFDENYLSEDWNYLTGGAYLLPDGKVQPGYDYLGLREYNKRLRYMFHDNGKPAPNLWEHTTGGQPVYAWMPDVSMEGENVEPTDLSSDYIDMLPSSRLRSIGMGRNLGSAPFVMCQALRHGEGRSFEDSGSPVCGLGARARRASRSKSHSGHRWPRSLNCGVMTFRFLPWWVKGTGIESTTSGSNCIGACPAGNSVLWIVNTNREDKCCHVFASTLRRSALTLAGYSGVRRRGWKAVRDGRWHAHRSGAEEDVACRAFEPTAASRAGSRFRCGFRA
jgi:hypothetical protein